MFCTQTIEVTQLFINSLVNNDKIEAEELNQRAENVDKPEDVASIIKEHEEIFRTKRKGIITVAYHQRKIFGRFLEKEKFARLVADFKIREGRRDNDL